MIAPRCPAAAALLVLVVAVCAPRVAVCSSSSSNRCRYQWSWEQLVYGDRCLPPIRSPDAKKETAIDRHLARHNPAGALVSDYLTTATRSFRHQPQPPPLSDESRRGGGGRSGRGSSGAGVRRHSASPAAAVAGSSAAAAAAAAALAVDAAVPYEDGRGIYQAQHFGGQLLAGVSVTFFRFFAGNSGSGWTSRRSR